MVGGFGLVAWDFGFSSLEVELSVRGWGLGLYGDNGQENGNYRDQSGYIGIIRVDSGTMEKTIPRR